MDKSEQPLRIRKPKQPLRKFNNPFRKSKQLFPKSKQPLRKSRLRKMCKYLPLREYLFLRREFLRKYSRYSKYRIRIRKRFFRSRRFFIRSRDQIHYKNMSVISRFIGYQGKIIPRRVTKLTLRQQRLMTTAIKKARILCFLPFLENERHFRRVRWRRILKRRRKRRSRKTRLKTEPRTIHPKNEPGTTRPKTRNP